MARIALNIFVSWSGLMSRKAAEGLREFLSEVFASKIVCWFSPADIEKGKMWTPELIAALARSNMGIICVTGSNRSSPWLLFEAGAMALSVTQSRVCPFLVDISPSDVDGPLAQFQITKPQRAEVFLLVRQINAQLARPVVGSRLNSLFEIAWPKLQKQLKKIGRPQGPSGRQDGKIRSELGRFLARLKSFEDFDSLFGPPPFDRISSTKRVKKYPLIKARGKSRKGS